MAIDRKISDLDNLPGLQFTPPQDGDYFLIAREDVNNYKLSYGRVYAQLRENVVFTTGNQAIEGEKTFHDYIHAPLIKGGLEGNVTGDLQGTARYVQDGLYLTGDQYVSGIKTFEQFIVGNVSGDLSGIARHVVHGVYTTGDQDIYGVKTFDEFLIGNVSGNLSGTARYVVDGVYVTGDQTIYGHKTFNSFISSNVSGNLSGIARYVQDGVYTTGNQTISGVKDFREDLLVSGKSIEVLIKSGISDVEKEISSLQEFSVLTTGDQIISGVKTFDSFISGNVSGNLSGTARYVQDGVYTTGNQIISGVKTFDSFISGNVSGNLSGTALYVQSGVYTTGDQQITGRKDFLGELYISGKPFSQYSTKLDEHQVLIITGFNQTVSGRKVFQDYLVPSGGITTTGEDKSLLITADENELVDVPGKSLVINFESGVYITGSDLHVQGKIYADEIEAVDSIMGNSGAMVLTDGRDPTLFEGPDESLIMGDSGAMVLTDGRDPALFEGPDYSLSMAFRSGVFITGGADLHVEGKIYAEEIEAIDSIAGESGAMVLTDGRDPALFEGPDYSLTMAFRSGVFITGGSLNLDRPPTIKGKNILKSSIKRTEIACNFWWSSDSKNVYLPIADSSSSKITKSEMGLESIRLMSYQGRVARISYSITKTNPHGIKNPQFNIITGQAVNHSCAEPFEECKLSFIDEDGLTSEDISESSNIEYEKWMDTFGIYNQFGPSSPNVPCCYPYPGVTPIRRDEKQEGIIEYSTPQQYIVYSQEFENKFHFNEKTFLAIQMDKDGNEGDKCFQGNINQPIMVTIELEEFLN